MEGHCLKIDCPGLNPALLLTVSQFISEVGIVIGDKGELNETL